MNYIKLSKNSCALLSGNIDTSIGMWKSLEMTFLSRPFTETRRLLSFSVVKIAAVGCLLAHALILRTSALEKFLWSANFSESSTL